ncbi:MAG: YkgJ family cysteine cluster protein [Promethearchaeota archaeon]
MKNKCESCGKCCINTEMILSQQDIDLIIQNYPKKLEEEEFIFKNQNGFFQLKNSIEKCVFFDNNLMKCKIYKSRPQGCRFYPMIYDTSKKKCTLDKDCPRTNLFYKNRKEYKLNCQNLKSFLKKQLNLKIN